MGRIKFKYLHFQWGVLLALCCSMASAQNTKPETVNEVKPLEFPVITEYINTKLFEGNLNQIKATIESRKQFINRLTDQLNIQLSTIEMQIATAEKQLEKDKVGEVVDNLNNKDINESLDALRVRKDKIFELINNFKDIHYKHVNLLHELEDSTKPQETPFQTSKPYHISSVLKLNDYLQKMSVEKVKQADQIEQISQRINKLASILSDVVVEYTILLSKDKTSLDLYDAIRNIYLYQADYAILKFKLNKNQNKLNHVSKEIDENQKLLPKMISEMLVTPEDVDALAKELELANAEYLKLQEEHKKLNKNFDKISFKAELELDNLEAKIKNPDTGIDVIKLQLQKQLNLHKIKYSYFIKNLLQQKELKLQIERDNKEFNLSWLQAYEHKKNKPSAFKNFIKTAQEKMIAVTDLQVKNLELLESLNRSTLEITSLQQTNNNDGSLPKKLLSEVNKQLDKNLKTIQRLSLQLNKNNNAIQESVDKNS